MGVVLEGFLEPWNGSGSGRVSGALEWEWFWKGFWSPGMGVVLEGFLEPWNGSGSGRVSGARFQAIPGVNFWSHELHFLLNFTRDISLVFFIPRRVSAAYWGLFGRESWAIWV
ncbi:hypothetical protein Pcinc_042129 [Petrolisthes cinctipes]|uniref:Uncharacterized protein n=1 Tax=Petrolisthes cinctipes TaxID=88211 RepID=A0AAE1BL85_PETCI|nr:hypothetical protein Pcinc_042129 [Petrolisthes cinctipes]